MTDDEYLDIFRIDAFEDWACGAYDEDGNDAVCDLCGGSIRWNPGSGKYICRDCGQEMDRVVFMNHIGASPPGSLCLVSCRENYPLCKKSCEVYAIDPDDPMLT